jgi:outer membrane protein assembly factor BamD
MKILRFRNAVLIGLVWLAAACASSQPRYDTMTPEDLLALAETEIADEDWDDAVNALDRFIFQYPTHAQYQQARFRLGEVYFMRGEYITAANEFARLATDYPSGPLAADARFRVCESYYELSPRPQLDQQYTRAAIDHCESLLAYYPNTEHADRARQMIAQLVDKLAEKLFQAGEHYYRRRAYDSAIQYFDDLLEQFPTSAAAPKSLLRLYQTYTTLGYAEEAQSMRERLLRDFPESEQARLIREISIASRP